MDKKGKSLAARDLERVDAVLAEVERLIQAVRSSLQKEPQPFIRIQPLGGRPCGGKPCLMLTNAEGGIKGVKFDLGGKPCGGGKPCLGPRTNTPKRIR